MVQFEQVYNEVVDYLMPLQTTYEHAIYQILLRYSRAEGKTEVRMGQKRLAKLLPMPVRAGQGMKRSRISASSQQHIRRALESLASKGHIEVGDTTFQGTLYRVKLPREIPECLARIQEREALQAEPATEDDFYKVPENRKRVFERDGYRCRYCGCEVTPDNATLDHIRPGDPPSLDKLVTACLKCNSIKGARKPDETLLDLLERFKQVIRKETT